MTWEDANRTLAVFIDAVLIKEETANFSLNDHRPNIYELGWSAFSGPNRKYFKGLMRDLQIFRKALSGAELRSVKGNREIKAWEIKDSIKLVALK